MEKLAGLSMTRMRIAPIFYASILAAVICSLSSPDECSVLESADSGSLAAHESEGRHVVYQIWKEAYPAGCPP